MNKGRIKILYLCADSGIPYWGTKGGSIHMREIVRCFAEKNSEVFVIARDAERESAEGGTIRYRDLPRVANDKMMVIFRDLSDDLKSHSEFENFYRNLALEQAIEEIYTRERFDIIYERYSLFCGAGIRISEKFGTPHILEVNAPLIEESTKYRRLVLSELASAVENRLFNNSDYIISVSDELKDYILRKAGDAKILVVPNGVRVDHFSSAIGHPSEDRGNRGFTVAFLGSLKPWHGVDILIQSFAEITEEDDDSRLMIIGDNKKYQGKLEKQCAKHGLNGKVTFSGAVDYDDIPDMLQKADVLAAPYPFMENFYFSALKVFEYMAAGKAIVASNIGQLSKILTHEKTALLVSPGDPVALKNALMRLKNDPKLRSRLGERALIEARRNHTWNQRADMILDVMESLIKKR